MLPASIRSKLEESIRPDIIYVTLTKGELLELRQTHRRLFEALSRHVVGYNRERAVLRPRSFEHFLRARKYEDSCTATSRLTLEDLVKAGVLGRTAVDGYEYWLLDGEILDPAKHLVLYVKTGLVASVFKGLGMEDLYRSGIVEKVWTDPTWGGNLHFEVGGVTFTRSVYRDGLVASWRGTTAGGDPLEVEMELDTAAPEKVAEASRWIKTVPPLLLEEAISNAWRVFQEFGVPVEKVRGVLNAKNFKVKSLEVEVKGTARAGRFIREAAVWIGFSHRLALDNSTNDLRWIWALDPLTTRIVVKNSFSSRILAKKFAGPLIRLIESLAPDPSSGVRVSCGHRQGRFIITVEMTFPGTSTRGHKWVAFARSFRKVMLSLVKELLGELYMNLDYSTFRSEDLDALKAILSADQRVALAASITVGLLEQYKTTDEMGKVPPLAKALLDLVGVSEPLAFEAVNNPYTVLAELAFQNRVDVVEEEVFLDGARISDLLPNTLAHVWRDRFLHMHIRAFKAMRRAKIVLPASVSV